MSRRAKLTRADKEKRAAKREQRAEGADERLANRRARERWQAIPRRVRARFQQAAQIYEFATRAPISSNVVCESCDFAQPYRTDEDGSFPTSETGVTLCLSQQFLGIPCSGEYAITVEHFSGS